MDKLSLYEFLSFFLPGITAMYIVYQLIQDENYFLKPTTNLLDGLMIGIVALIAGLLIHRISFLWLRYKWYQWLVYPSVNTIVEKNREGTKPYYSKLKENTEHENDTPGELFDKAYYYLECNDKINTAKMFQGMYFCLRNLVTLCLIMIPGISISLIFYPRKIDGVFIITLCISLIIMSAIAHFYREKMIIRIFANYYMALKK